jgi:signal transduction histidine kinase
MKQASRGFYSPELFSGIAHEIRNPLQGIIASASALGVRLEGDQAVQTLVHSIYTESSRISRIIDEMLELVRPIHPEERLYSVPKLLNESISLLQKEFTAEKASICFISNESLPLLRVDSQRIVKSFSTLLRNAVESNADQIRINAEFVSDEDSIFISIQDNGTGIFRDDLPKVFEPFFSTASGRLGLGLSIADYIIRSHQGKLTVESEPGEGTLVTVALPVAR